MKTSFQTRKSLILLADIILYPLVMWITLYFKGLVDSERVGVAVHITELAPLYVLWLGLLYIEGLYGLESKSREDFLISLMRTYVLIVAATFVYFYLSPFATISPKSNAMIFFALASLGVWASRFWLGRFFSSKRLRRTVYIHQNEQDFTDLKYAIEQRPQLGLEVKVINEMKDISEGELLVISRQSFQDEMFVQTLMDCVSKGVQVLDKVDLIESVTGCVPPDSVDQLWFVQNIKTVDKSYFYWKRFIDFSVSFLLILFLIPLFILLIPVLLIFSGRPLHYSQVRTGIYNRPFRIYKLRTMSVNAEVDGAAKWATPNDARVTSIGRFLRASRIDELPQLYNILKGDMSLVGPRPERPEIIKEKLAPSIAYYNLRHLVLPGVTGWAQVNYRYGYSLDDSLKKLTYDLYYVKNKSALLDIKVVLKTVKTVLTGVGH